ncbi:MAG: SDR family NAD(P)-dependent oxidoreductase, partial [Gemmatimonadaceae bacterium]
MDLGIRGKVALVSASSKGLGRAIAEELAAEGANLVLCARGADALRQTADSIRKSAGVTVVDVAADVSEQAGIDSVAQAALDKFGKVDILVTNSGGPPSGSFDSFAPEAWEQATRLLLMSAVGLSRAVLPGMKERRWGRILNVTSIAVKQPIEGLMLSNSLRAAVTGFARTLANEVARFNVTVNNILPGYTRTDRVEHLARATSEKSGT